MKMKNPFILVVSLFSLSAHACLGDESLGMISFATVAAVVLIPTVIGYFISRSIFKVINFSNVKIMSVGVAACILLTMSLLIAPKVLQFPKLFACTGDGPVHPSELREE